MLRIPTDSPPTHPGEMLREEFLIPFEMTAEDLGRRIRISGDLVDSLVRERGRITPDLALRLSRAFGTTAEFWLNGQLIWDLYQTTHGPEAAEIEGIEPLSATG